MERDEAKQQEAAARDECQIYQEAAAQAQQEAQVRIVAVVYVKGVCMCQVDVVCVDEKRPSMRVQ